MKLLVLLISLSTIFSFGDSWTVTLNKKKVFSASKEDPSGNIVRIKNADLKKSGHLVITYLEKDVKKDWQRSIILYDQADKELQRVASGKLDLSNASVAGLFRHATSISVYTVSLPTDPALQAQVRVRRVHLCTIELKK
jgi:hypothetical protein